MGELDLRGDGDQGSKMEREMWSLWRAEGILSPRNEILYQGVLQVPLDTSFQSLNCQREIKDKGPREP